MGRGWRGRGVNDGVELRELLELRFSHMEQEMTRMWQEMVGLRGEMTVVSVELGEVRKQVQEMDAHLRVLKWIGGVLATVSVALGVSWLESLLGV
jgi:hypothetical protein